MLEDRARTRKSIHEIDCLAVDATLAASFDWRELANRLSSCDKKVPASNVGNVQAPYAIYRMAHAVCHADQGFSGSLTGALNTRHRKRIEAVEKMSLGGLSAFINQAAFEASEDIAGFLWALATDLRPGAEKILRYFLHRSVTYSFSRGFRAEGEKEALRELSRMFQK